SPPSPPSARTPAAPSVTSRSTRPSPGLDLGCHGAAGTRPGGAGVGGWILHVTGSVDEGERLMRKRTRFVVGFLKTEDGPTAVEYAVMLALIIVVCITAITTLGKNANGTFDFVSSKVSST